jgi:uncharacterized pyridoxamine 5'-phosphate oxidase family protein
MSHNKICSVKDCDDAAVKTVSRDKFSVVNMELKGGAGRKIYLCKKHYKEYKKARKKIDRLERWRWM